jgi:hypothetical protein
MTFAFLIIAALLLLCSVALGSSSGFGTVALMVGAAGLLVLLGALIGHVRGG